MTQKKLPRDLMGILFYVFGWIIGMTIKAVLVTTGFACRMIHTAFKRDQFNRRLRIAACQTENEMEPLRRALGREELRYLAATIGLTNARWHQSVKLRRRMSEIVNRAGAEAIERNDLNQLEAGIYTDEVYRLLFANFDRNLLTTEIKDKKRIRRISKNKGFQEKEVIPEAAAIQPEPEVKEIYTTSKLVHPNIADKSIHTQPVRIDDRNLNVENFSSVSTTEWASTDEELPVH